MADLTQLEVFVRVVDAASFTAAAEGLGVSKSFVSRQVSGLEDRLGARLLNRTTRKITLTDMGRVFHERCTRILEELEEAEAAVTSMQNNPRGTLRVSAPMSFGVRYVAPVVAEFMGAHPDLRMHVDFNDRRADLVDDGYDLAVRIGKLEDSSFIARKLATTRIKVWASPQYLETHGTPKKPEHLRDHVCLRYAYLAGNSWPLEGPKGQQVTVPIDGRAVFNNGEALVACAARGLGLIWSPDFLVAQEVARGELVPVVPKWGSTLTVWAVYPHSRHLSAKVRMFVDALAAAYADAPWTNP